jgi:hypothetical protein
VEVILDWTCPDSVHDCGEATGPDDQDGTLGSCWGITDARAVFVAMDDDVELVPPEQVQKSLCVLKDASVVRRQIWFVLGQDMVMEEEKARASINGVSG